MSTSLTSLIEGMSNKKGRATTVKSHSTLQSGGSCCGSHRMQLRSRSSITFRDVSQFGKQKYMNGCASLSKELSHSKSVSNKRNAKNVKKTIAKTRKGGTTTEDDEEYQLVENGFSTQEEKESCVST